MRLEASAADTDAADTDAAEADAAEAEAAAASEAEGELFVIEAALDESPGLEADTLESEAEATAELEGEGEGDDSPGVLGEGVGLEAWEEGAGAAVVAGFIGVLSGAEV